MAPTACKQTGSGSIALLYARFFSPFPHGTCSLSVSREYLALRDGPRRFTQDYSCPALLRILLSTINHVGYATIMLYGATSQTLLLWNITKYRSPTTPILPKQNWFGLIPVRSPLLRESLLFSSPIGTEMFQFPTFALYEYSARSPTWRVAPFGNLRITSYVPIPAAYRSLSRPSSPPRAKASTVCPCLLFYLIRKIQN